MTTVLSGKGLAADLRARATVQAAELSAAGTHPRLAVVVATADESSAWYVRSIAKTAEKCGIACTLADLGPEAAPAGIRATLTELSEDPGVHGIILQTPLPPGADFDELASDIDPAKDVDGANPVSLGRLMAHRAAFAPATAEAVLAVLDHHEVPVAGRHAVVVGRSTVVGNPTAQLLLQRDATITICHRHTKDLAAHTSQAAVLVSAVGRAGLITAEHIASDAIVIDVGTNPTVDGGLVGDVDAASVHGRAAGLTPVPGGVGPVTTALLLQHTVQSAARAG
jgi:methylenetetrahydrofolate dehydrogenase (NADP+)/methenyltetrahydrofolate cyclohydrolase